VSDSSRPANEKQDANRQAPAAAADAWSKPSLSAGSGYLDLLSEYPVTTTLATAAALYVGYRAAPAMVRALPRTAGGLLRNAPEAAVIGAGLWGGSKLLFSEASDVMQADNWRDRGKYLTAAAADMTMAAGAVGSFIPQIRPYAMFATAGGAATRAAIGYFGAPEQTPLAQPAIGLTQHWSVDVPTASGAKENRIYDAYVPKGNEKMPVVLVLHGVAGGDAQGLMERETGMNALADEKKFIAVYPVAKEKNFPYSLGLTTMQDWNSPGAGVSVTKSSYDDVDYIKAVLADLKNNKNLNIDENAIYAMGFSSGGEFVNHLRGRMPRVFAGIGSVHGTVLGTEAKPVNGDDTAFVSVLSDSDHMLPMNGGRGLMTAPFVRIADSNPLKQKDVARDASGCLPFPIVSQNGHVHLTEYKPAQPGGAFVKEYVIEGGLTGGVLGGILGRGRGGIAAEHAWDGPFTGGWPILGEKNRDLNISRMLIDDLLKHRRQEAQTDAKTNKAS